jgi:hypothetical protein
MSDGLPRHELDQLAECAPPQDLGLRGLLDLQVGFLPPAVLTDAEAVYVLC